MHALLSSQIRSIPGPEYQVDFICREQLGQEEAEHKRVTPSHMEKRAEGQGGREALQERACGGGGPARPGSRRVAREQDSKLALWELRQLPR